MQLHKLACMQLHKLKCSYIHKLTYSYISLHAITRACMQFPELACSSFLHLSSSQEFCSACFCFHGQDMNGSFRKHLCTQGWQPWWWKCSKGWQYNCVYNKTKILQTDKNKFISSHPFRRNHPCLVHENRNKHCEILVSCSDKERNCIQAHETACKLI